MMTKGPSSNRLRRKVQPFGGLLLALACSCGPLSGFEKEVQSESGRIAASLADRDKTTLAVVDFTDLQGSVTELGRFMAEEFSVALAEAGGGLQVVDRTHLRSLLEEHELSSTGLIDPKTARELGKIAGVGALVTGSITPFGDSIRIAIKVLDTDTALIVMSSSVNFGKTPAIEELLRREVQLPRGSTHRSHEPRSRSIDTVIADEFRYELLSCVHQGDSVRCSLRLTNLTEDRNLLIDRGSSRIIGEDGLEYSASGVAIGNQVARSWVERTLPKDVPVMAFVWFGKVSQPSRRIAVMELNANRGRIQFRDIALER